MSQDEHGRWCVRCREQGCTLGTVTLGELELSQETVGVKSHEFTTYDGVGGSEVTDGRVESSQVVKEYIIISSSDKLN